jgi:peptide/nickel transport system permease protein
VSGRYLGERLIIFVATVVISMTVVFLLPRLAPGDPLGAIFVKMSQMGAGANSQALLEDYRHRFGLDKSLGEQYLAYVKQLAHGDLGYSISNFPTRVSDKVRAALPWTIGLLTLTTLISWILGTVLGAVVGWAGWHNRALRGLVPVALLFYTTPYYILAIILIYLFAFRWTAFPLAGAYSPGAERELSVHFVGDVIHHGTLPALSIILVSMGWWILSMRSLIVAEQGQDYVLWAEAKGLPPGRIFWAYGFRNALLPQATGLALSLGSIVSGALITEVIFGYPGIGYLIYNSIKQTDYPVIQGSVLLIVVSVAAANLIIDLLYPLIDPRIRAGGSRST